jgi:LuxR family maltose regulon positive regulatory protein
MMARLAPQLAKLTRPRLHKAVARERLFALLDDAREHKPAACVVGPPGSGKTTLVASWLDARSIKGIWYQVDPGDADLATFFYYLREVALPYSQKTRQTLPLLTPEYQHDIEGFSRRFFRTLFGLLPEGCAVVLDNYQEVESSQLFHELVAQAIAEIPAGRVLVAVSRRDPPDCYARLIANENVSFVDWDGLKFSLEEARAIIGARQQDIDGAEIERLFEDSGGWAAGLTLMLNSYRKLDRTSQGLPTEYESIFSYFATQIFEHLPTSTREFLVATAILPQLPVSLARDLTGNAQASEILEDLYKRHLFTHRRPGAEPTYWYHALFRSFLRSKAADVLTAEIRRETERKAARLLEARLDYDDAFQLFHDAGDWPAARRLIERHAQTLLAHGRGQTLRDWVVALPNEVLEDSPWLSYWLGTSLIPLDQSQARGHLERAFGQFTASGNVAGQALSAAGVIDGYIFEWSDFRPMRRWVDTLDPLLDRMDFSTNPDAERRIFTSLLVGMLYVAPDHRLLSRAVERVTEMLDEEMDVNSKVSTAMVLLSYCNIACDTERGKIAVARADPLVSHPELSPFNQVWWHCRKGYFFHLMGDYRSGRDTLDRAVGLIEMHGLQGLRRTFLLIASYQTLCFIMLGDVRNAKEVHTRMVAGASPDRPLDIFYVALARVHLAFAAGNYRAVVDDSRNASDLAAAAGMRYAEIVYVETEAAGLAVLGDYDRLDDTLSHLRRLISGTCFASFECEARLLEAYTALMHGDAERERGLLKNAVAFARAHHFQYPQMMRYAVVPGTVLAEALRIGVETDYVSDVIRRLQIRPPLDAPAGWPWPVKIHALGCFEIERDGQTLEFSGKAPRRVLAVLKAIVAGGGVPVPRARLVDTLWPEEEGDAGGKALGVCLVRLRKLLGHTEAVVVREEQVSLNRALCWVDAWAFTDMVKLVESGDESPQPITRLGIHALELYRGSLLPADEEDGAIIVARLKLRDMHARLVSTLGQQMEAAGNLKQALACYRRGTEVDELAEEFYQGMMRCHAATGRSAEGIAVYRRLRQTLSVVLGLQPSSGTEQLVQLLRDESAGSGS